MSTVVIGLLSVECHLPGARSLKDKRRVLRGLRDHLQGLNVSVAEVEHQDLWQRVGLAVVAVGSSRAPVERTLDGVVTAIERRQPGLVTQTHTEWL